MTEIIELTKEEQIIKFIKDSGISLTNKTICDKFLVSLDYVLSLKLRIKSGHIVIEDKVIKIEE